MFPHQHQNDDDSTFFQFVSDFDQPQSITEKPLFWDFATTAAGNTSHTDRNKAQRRGKAVIDSENPADVDDDSRKKIVHRNVERQRRKEMATLYASLRDLLPLEYIKGKRSVSDHMGSAVSYIKDLQKRVGQLGEKRDGLKKLSSSATFDSTMTSSNSSSANFVQVRPCLGGVEVVVGSCVALSRVMEVLLGEGLCVVSCISTRVDEGMIHTIRTDQVSNPATIDISQLQGKLIQEFSSSASEFL